METEKDPPTKSMLPKKGGKWSAIAYDDDEDDTEKSEVDEEDE